MKLEPKVIYRSLAFSEVGLLIVCLFMIKVADTLREDNGFFYFIVFFGVMVIIPLTLVFLCETARFFLRKEFEND